MSEANHLGSERSEINRFEFCYSICQHKLHSQMHNVYENLPILQKCPSSKMWSFTEIIPWRGNPHKILAEAKTHEAHVQKQLD